MPEKINVDTDKTFIDELYIKKFRSFEDVNFSIGKNLTMISGMNGTGKSTVLGILAQICSFDKDYVPTENEASESDVSVSDLTEYKTIFNRPFESNFRNHFKISPKYDLPNDEEYIVNFKINDAGEKLYTSAELKGTHRENNLRLVLRKDKTITKNSSRNITFPTIYLSLRRLTPYVNRKESIPSFKLSKEEQRKFIQYTNNIFMPLNKLEVISSNEDGKTGVSSAVVTNDRYDIQSASTGEDNLGQIINAMLSFIRLKEKWNGYHGGLLLIDELDASIFPYAQKTLLRELNTFSSKYNVQIVFTTHSPIIMKEMLLLKKKSEKSAKTSKNYGINFISNDFGKPENHINFSLDEMTSKLNMEDMIYPRSSKVNCYCEDSEAYYFLNSLLNRNDKKYISQLKNIKLGGKQLIELRRHKIPEFTYQSLIILDGDTKVPKGYKNFCQLPSSMAPDQLIFRILDESDPGADYWRTDPNWNKLKFLNDQYYKKISNDLFFDDESNSYKLSDDTTNHKHVREYFKEWYNHNESRIKLAKLNPIKQLWMPEHLKEVSKFKDEFEQSLKYVFNTK